MSESRTTLITALLAVALLGGSTLALAQQTPAGATQGRGQTPAGGQRGPGRGAPPARPEPLPFEYHVGFESIFDGKTLTGWDGDPRFWRVEDGAIVGQTTPENKLEENTFVIWRGGEPADFELKLEFRINGTNSGIQFRSVQLPQGVPDSQGRPVAGKWAMKGYQYDIDFANTYTGQIYEERGRGFLAMRGQMTYVPPDGSTPRILGSLQVGNDDLKGIIKVNDWNQAIIMAHGNRIIQVLNGHIVSILIDNDEKGRALKGLLGFQMHVGEPMRVEFRNIWLKKL